MFDHQKETEDHAARLPSVSELAKLATVDAMGGTPDLFYPDGYREKDSPWDDWSNDVLKAIKSDAKLKEVYGNLLRECQFVILESWSDIGDTARSNQMNLNGIDLVCPKDGPHVGCIGKNVIHQQGIDASLSVRAHLQDVLRKISYTFEAYHAGANTMNEANIRLIKVELPTGYEIDQFIGIHKHLVPSRHDGDRRIDRDTTEGIDATDLLAERDRLRESNAELLAACKCTLKLLRDHNHTHDTCLGPEPILDMYDTGMSAPISGVLESAIANATRKEV